MCILCPSEPRFSLECPSEQQHKIIYRGPYVKGPEDKPFLEGETVWGLIR
jgi:hypothetical protein